MCRYGHVGTLLWALLCMVMAILAPFLCSLYVSVWSFWQQTLFALSFLVSVWSFCQVLCTFILRRYGHFDFLFLPFILPRKTRPYARQVRRWGIAGCVRNCCFEELDQAWLLHEVKVVPHLLMRLSDDADEYDFDEKVKLASNNCISTGAPLYSEDI